MESHSPQLGLAASRCEAACLLTSLSRARITVLRTAPGSALRNFARPRFDHPLRCAIGLVSIASGDLFDLVFEFKKCVKNARVEYHSTRRSHEGDRSLVHEGFLVAATTDQRIVNVGDGH